MAETHQPEQTRSLIAMFWPHRLTVLVMVVLGAVAGFALSAAKGQGDVSATSKIFLSRTQPFEPFAQNAQQVDPLRYTANQVSLLTSTPVLDAASTALPDHPSLQTLQDTTKAETSSTADVISVTVKAKSGSTAAQRANAIVTAYRTMQRDDVNTQANAAADVAPDAATKAQILAQAQIAGDGVAVAEPASASNVQKSSSRVTYVILGALIGLLLGLVGAIVAESTKGSRKRSRVDPAEVLGVPLLGAVTRPSESRAVTGANTIELHSARRLLATLEYASRRPFSGVLIITAAAVYGEGNAALEVACAAAADGRRVILVDARTPRTRGGGEPILDEPSLVELASPEVALQDVARYWTAFPGRQIPVVPARVADSAGGWLGPSMSIERALLRLSNEADLVVVDAPPTTTDETFLLMGLADAGVVVVTPQTSAEELEYVRSAFDFAGRPLIGFVTDAQAGKKSRALTRTSGSQTEPNQPNLAPASKV